MRSRIGRTHVSAAFVLIAGVLVLSTTPAFAPSANGVSVFKTVVRINAGGPAFTDFSGDQWAADNSFTGGKSAETTESIETTLGPELFQTARLGASAYALPLTNGHYVVRLGFADWGAASAGQIFSVSANDEVLADKIDVRAEIADHQVSVRGYSVDIDDGALKLAFAPVGTGTTTAVSTIEITRQSSDGVLATAAVAEASAQVADAVDDAPDAQSQPTVKDEQTPSGSTSTTASTAAASKGLGIAWGSGIPTAAQLDDMKSLGVEWLRFDVGWSWVQAGGSSSYQWTELDALVAGLDQRNIKPLVMIGETPEWARSSQCKDDQFCEPATAASYVKFASTVAKRYSPKGVHDYEIWNEPNFVTFWKPYPNPAKYADMLIGAYDAIHTVDANARVITGGMAATWTDENGIESTDFLQQLYQQGIKGKFDVVGAHPYCWTTDASFTCPTDNANWSEWSRMSWTKTSLRSIMVANGDGAKQIWATEMGQPTTSGLSEAQQAAMLTAAVSKFRAFSWSGPLMWYSYRDACTDSSDTECRFGLVSTTGKKKAAYTAFAAAAKL